MKKRTKKKYGWGRSLQQFGSDWASTGKKFTTDWTDFGSYVRPKQTASKLNTKKWGRI